MKALMQHNTLAKAAWLPLALASGACSMDLPLGDMSRDEHGLVDDGASAAVPATVDGAVPSTLLPPDVTFGVGEQLWGAEPVVGADLDADGYDDLAIAGRDVATGTQVVHVRYGGPRPRDASEVFTLAEGGARLSLPASDIVSEAWYNALFAAGDVDGDGYADLLVTNGVCDGQETGRGGYLIYGGPQRLDGIIDIASVSTHFSPPPSAGDGSSCAYIPATAPGDLDGDGLSDLVLVYPGTKRHWETYSGVGPTIASGLPGAYVFYGKRERWGSNVSWTSADARISSSLSGDPVRERDEITVHTVGDLNGDGSAELGINYVPWAEPLPPTEGPTGPVAEQILLPGGERLASHVDSSALPLRVPGLFTQGGHRALGDVDGDGFDDILARFGEDYMLFYGALDLLDAPLDRARAAARIVTNYNGLPVPLGDLDGDGDTELGVSRYMPERSWAETIDVAVLSGTRARSSGDVTFTAASVAGARIYPSAPSADTRTVAFIAAVGDFDADGAGDVLTRSAADADAVANASPMLHLHYGKHAEPALSGVPR